MKKAIKKPEAEKSFETFKPIMAYNISDLTETSPYCWGGGCFVRKFKITTELIDEPIEVIQERILKLWMSCDNYHNWDCIQKEAAKYRMDKLDYSIVGKNKVKK